MLVCGEQWVPQDWDSTINWAASSWTYEGLSISVKNLMLGSVVYCIWKERNLRTFQDKARSVEALWVEISEIVRYKLMSYQVKCSFESTIIWDAWNL